MKNKFITTTLVGIVLFIFIVYFSTVNFLMRYEQRVDNQLQQIIQFAKKKDWNSTNEYLTKLNESWDTLQYFFMLNFASEDYNTFEEKIASLNQTIMLEDDKETVMSATQALYHWNNMIRIIPKP